MESPPTHIAALSSAHLDVLHGPPQAGKTVYEGQAGTRFRYSPDGNEYVICNGEDVRICDSDGGTVKSAFSAEFAVTMLSFSFSGQYLVTHEKVKEKGTDHQNLKVWKSSTGDLVAAFHKRGITDEGWPAIQFDTSDKHLFFIAKDAVVVYDMDGDFSKAAYKVQMPGVTQFNLCPTNRKLLGSFVPESRGNKPAVFACNEWIEGGSVVNRKQFFRAQRCRLLWNSRGSHLLGHTSCDFDSTNQSYFGESRLYLLSADGNLDMQVTMDNESAIQDAAWSPDGLFFVALGGISPAIAVLFNSKGKPLNKIDSGAYNQAVWSPHSRFLLLAGFGNMPGDVRLFDKKADHSCKPMGGCRSACSVQVEWSPCGRFFLTASVAPRMRVDNRVTVFTYYGTEVANMPYQELREACWRPRMASLYPDRGQSPERLKEVAESKKQGVNLTAVPKAAAYVPRHMRGQKGGQQVEGFDADEAAGRIREAFGNRTKTVEGAEGLESKSKSKNAKRRANAKAKKAQATDDQEAQDVAAAVEQVSLQEPQPDAAGGGQVDPAKRLRNLRKKLTKVVQAKEK